MTRKRKVLLILDDPKLSDYLASFIPLLGPYEPEPAASGVEALAKINAYEPALVILDLDSKQADGKEILKEIKSHHPKTKLLVFADNRAELKNLKIEEQVEILLKPAETASLSALLKTILGSAESAGAVRLLIADDEPEINEFLKENFEPLGYEVHTALDGEEALRVFQEKKCDVVIIDIKMPKMSGRELILRLEQSVTPPKPKAILIMTAGLGEAVDEFKRLGYPLFEKPLDIERVKQAVLEACEKHGLAVKK